MISNLILGAVGFVVGLKAVKVVRDLKLSYTGHHEQVRASVRGQLYEQFWTVVVRSIGREDAYFSTRVSRALKDGNFSSKLESDLGASEIYDDNSPTNPSSNT